MTRLLHIVASPRQGDSKSNALALASPCRGDAMSVLEINLAGLSETLLACRSVKETRTELALQLRYLAGNRGGRDAKEACGRRKAPFLYHSDKQLHIRKFAHL